MTTRLQLNTALLGAVAVTAALEAVYYYGGIRGVPDDPPWRATAVASTGAALTALALWRWCGHSHPRDLAERSGRLGVLAVLSFLGVWVGVFGPVCAAAVVAGSSAIATGRVRAGRFAVGAGVLVAVAGAVVCALGGS